MQVFCKTDAHQGACLKKNLYIYIYIYIYIYMKYVVST